MYKNQPGSLQKSKVTRPAPSLLPGSWTLTSTRYAHARYASRNDAIRRHARVSRSLLTSSRSLLTSSRSLLTSSRSLLTSSRSLLTSGRDLLYSETSLAYLSYARISRV